MINLLVLVKANVDGFPSGQRGQTVNLLRHASMVRIHLHPLCGYGGIGRHKRLKISRRQLRAGSSPATRMEPENKSLRKMNAHFSQALFFCLNGRTPARLTAGSRGVRFRDDVRHPGLPDRIRRRNRPDDPSRSTSGHRGSAGRFRCSLLWCRPGSGFRRPNGSCSGQMPARRRSDIWRRRRRR